MHQVYFVSRKFLFILQIYKKRIVLYQFNLINSNVVNAKQSKN